MKRVLREYKHALLGLYFVIYVAWFLLDENLITGNYTVIYHWLDDLIPFCEVFVLPYVLWYPFFAGVGVFLLLKDKYEFCRYMWAMIIGLSFCLAFYLVVPNGQELRPEVFPRDNLFSRMVANLYAADTNTNVFPSMHVFGTIAPAVAVIRYKGFGKRIWLKLSAVILALLICLSTLFIKQHSILDLIGGAVLYVPVYFLIYFKGGRGSLWIWPAEPLRKPEGSKARKRRADFI
ncbi:MAG TPA: phosphatase PAP2 family protein [Clostridiales bacterium]|jgi:membrane-associated phospholipid phosphatase|nr:phosphatase PAP2 family protein [Clostridiales bacterium]